MKKSTLLSLLTAGTIVVTSVGTYAAWDQTQASTTASVKFRSPVTVNVGTELSLIEKSSDLGTIPSATGSVTFNVDTGNGQVDTMTITPTITGSNVTTNDFEIEIKDTGDSSAVLPGTVTDGFVDKTLTSTIYEVIITPKNVAASKISGQSIDVQLTAELSKSVGV